MTIASRYRSLRHLPALALITLISAPLHAAPPQVPGTWCEDFEDDRRGDLPRGWWISGTVTRAGVDDRSCRLGDRCLELKRLPTIDEPRPSFAIVRTVGVEPGTTVRLSARVHVVPLGLHCEVRPWIQVVRKGPNVRHVGDAVGEGTHEDVSLVAEIPPDARTVRVGFRVTGPGRVWLDDACLTPVGAGD